MMVRCVVALACCWLGLLPQWAWGDCVKKGPCRCESPKGMIDLSPLDGNGNPTFKDQPASKDFYQYSWNPCSSFSEYEGCQNVAGCQVGSGGVAYAIGTQDTASFSTDPTTGDLTLQYSATDATGNVRRLSVGLECDPIAKPGTLVVVGEDTSLNYVMALSSYYCCPGVVIDDDGEGGLSVGSVLLILFVSLVVVYAIAGVVFMKYVRKAEGREVIPNYALWTALPGLIKDGALFTSRSVCSLCGRRGGYDKV